MAVVRLGFASVKILNEPWNEYVIKDSKDVPLRGRLILTKFIRLKDPSRGQGGRIAQTTIFVTAAPDGLTGTPSEKLPPPDQIPKEQLTQLQSEIVKEDWNKYYVVEDKLTLKLRLLVTDVFKSPYYAADGDPYYIIINDVIGEVFKEEEKGSQSKVTDKSKPLAKSGSKRD